MKKLITKVCLLLLTISGIFIGCKKMEKPVAGDDTRGSFVKKNNAKSLSSSGDGIYDLLGFGYDISEAYGDSESARFKVLDIERFIAENPLRYDPSLAKLQYWQYASGSNAYYFLDSISRSMGLTVEVADSAGKAPYFKGTLTQKFNNGSMFSSKYVYSSASLIIKQKSLKINGTYELLKQYLTPTFLSDVQNQSVNYIVDNYGTHLLMNVILGAKAEFMYSSQTNSARRSESAKSGLDIKILGIFSLITDRTTNSQNSSTNFDQTLVYKLIGGNPSVPIQQSFPLDNSTPTVSLSSWMATSEVSNAELIGIGQNGIVPLWYLVPDAIKAQQLKDYIFQYLNDRRGTVNYEMDNLYRWYRPGTKDRMLTTSFELSAPTWSFEGSIGKIFKDNSKEGITPLYRVQLLNGRHFFTTSYAEANTSGTFEGIIGYISKTQLPGTIPLYRYRSNTTAHLYTTDYSAFGQGANGYFLEGMIGYIYQP